MAKRLYVGNLSWSTTNDSLSAFFAQVGTVVSAEVVTNKFDGRSKGFGFVEMSSDEEAERAIAELNRKELDGRMVFVNEARPPAPRGSFRNDNFRGGDRNDRRDNYRDNN